MAIGDDAIAAGYETVPESGENGRVRWGAREINRTRDYIAAVKAAAAAAQAKANTVETQTRAINRGGTGATTAAAARTNLGITSGTGNPSGGSNGDIYFKIT